MKSITKRNWLTWSALLLALPTAYFFCIALLKYELGINGPFDAIDPFFVSLGIREPLGWNINLLILFGPIIACLLVVFQVLKVKWEFTRDDFQFHFTVRRHWFSILVGAFSLSLLGVLFIYLFGENCHCQ
ncbi:MAG TPA: hypothetical protein VI461_08850 [Chitinophagaceae bacterium]|nr:hypothetical protein [Chitinophagaceae bacterium]